MKLTSFLLSFGIVAICATATYGASGTTTTTTTCGPTGSGCAPALATSASKANSNQSKVATSDKVSKDAVPDVVYPYTFTCPHCGMKITVANVADWKKDCTGCACGSSKLGCYNAVKKPKS